MPTPPATCNAPAAVELETVVAVIASPDVERIYDDGLNDNVLFEDTATPDPVAVGENSNV